MNIPEKVVKVFDGCESEVGNDYGKSIQEGFQETNGFCAFFDCAYYA